MIFIQGVWEKWSSQRCTQEANRRILDYCLMSKICQKTLDYEPNYYLMQDKSKLKLRCIVLTTCIKWLNVLNFRIFCNVEVFSCLRKQWTPGNFGVWTSDYFMDSFKELFGKTLNVRRKMEFFMVYHMSQKNKNALFIKCTCRIKSVWSKNSVKPRWFCDFLYKGISLMVLFSTGNSCRHTDEIISLWSITVWVQTQSYPSCMISLQIGRASCRERV